MCAAPCREELCTAEGLSLYTSVEELRHVWIPLSLKMTMNKNKELEVTSWNEGEEVREMGGSLLSLKV